MTWLHNETKASIKRLVNGENNKSTHQTIYGDITGHFKKIDQTDGSFDISNIDGTAYKFSCKGKIDIRPSDRFIIECGEFEGKYSVQDFRFTKGISYETTKIFVIK